MPPSIPPGPGPLLPPPLAPFQFPPSLFSLLQPPPPPRTDNSFGNFHIPSQLSSANFSNRDKGLSGNIFDSQTQTLTRDKEQEKVVQDSVQKELNDTIDDLPDPPRLELGDGLLSSLDVEDDDNLEQKFVNKKEEEDAALEQIKEDYNFDETKDSFGEGGVPHQLEFFYSGENNSFNQATEFLSQSNENREFIAFLLSYEGQNSMTNNILPIYIESGYIFYHDFTTYESFYNLYLLNQTIRQLQDLKEFHTLTVLKSIE